MKSISKKSIVTTSLIICGLASSFAIAGNAGNVKNTAHNFSSGGSGGYSYQSKDVKEVCVFCHTPHNAGSTRLLWNKANNSAPNFRLYTSSGTLSTTVRLQSTLSATSPSLLCLGCHDGVTAMNVLHSAPSGTSQAAPAGYPSGSSIVMLNNGTYGSTAPGGGLSIPKKGAYDFGIGDYLPSNAIGLSASDQTTGTNLTDDHPIGFSYSDVATETPTRINSIATVNTKSGGNIRFFGPKQKVECSTCHDPHVDYSFASGNTALTPFLVMSNAQSSLCLACHNK